MQWQSYIGSLISVLQKTCTITIDNSVIEPGIYYAQEIQKKMKE